jgi:branched-chain amino acid transport system permease protein
LRSRATKLIVSGEPLLLAAVVAGLALVAWKGDLYQISLMIIVAIHVIATAGLTLLLGFAGQVSLAQAAFYGLGAYGSMIGTVHLGWNPWLALVATASACAVIAYVIGVPALRLHGHYLALATLGFGIIVNIVLVQETEITGGPTGIASIPRLSLGGIALTSDRAYFVFVWTTALALLLVCRRLVTGSAYGRVLRALQASEVATASVGIDVARYKVQIFVLTAVLGSVAGSLFAHYLTVISPSEFGFDVSIEFLVMAVIGGLGSVWGALLGVLVVTFLLEMLRTVAPMLAPNAPTSEYEVIAFGALLVLALLFLPDGLAGSWARVTRLRGRMEAP